VALPVGVAYWRDLAAQPQGPTTTPK